MRKLFDLLNRAIAMNDDIVETAYDTPANKALIVELNTMDQLYEKGILGDGGYLPDYSNLTKQIKSDKGQRIDHMTLKDTGAMYASERVDISNGVITMTMDTVKDGEDLQERYAGYGRILGLTMESRAKLNRKVKPNLIREAKKWLQKG